MLPGGGDRCSVAQPHGLSAQKRALAALVSQSERLPWLSQLDVLAYARTERSPALGKRAVVELLRFAPAASRGVEVRPRARERSVEVELARVLERPLRWLGVTELAPDAADACAGEPTCVPVLARRIDAQTIQLVQGDWGTEPGSESDCIAALREAPDALEVSARTALLGGTDLRASRTRIELAPDGLRRITSKRYAEVEAAERAMREALHGRDELPTLAGIPASSLGERHGELIVQSSWASFADLQLALDDQRRASSAREQRRAPASLARVDPHDAEAVRGAFDAQQVALRARPDPALLARLAELLERARALHPDDEGLLRRHYLLELGLRDQPAAALALANLALARGLGDATEWQLQKRSALARIDEPALRAELRSAHDLPPEAAARMARELRDKVRAGQDYERAEWAFLLARRLASTAHRAPRAALAVSVPVRELARLLAYLGQSARPEDDLGVHVLAYGLSRGGAAAGSSVAAEALWAGDTAGAGRSAVVFAATSWDDAQLRALGQALSVRLEEGPFELLVGLEGLRHGRRATLALWGHRRGEQLVIEQASRPLAALPWSTLERLLLAPLRGLVGATFPPDELVVRALDADEAGQLLRAAEGASTVKCAIDGLQVRCHGALSDPSAGRRALISLLHERLAAEARRLWSGLD